MKKLSTIVLIPLLALAGAAAGAARTPADQAVLKPIHAFFAGMSARDAAAIRQTTVPGGTLVLMRDGKPVQMTFDDFADRIAKPGTTKIEERIHDPLIRIDHDLAIVWAPFDFFVDGKVDHCGTDLFVVVRQNDGWRIASVADTSRNTCGAR